MKLSNYTKIILIVIVLVLVGGGIFAWQHFKETEKSGLISETAGWRTHHSEEFGFEIKYPNNWELYVPSHLPRVNHLNRIILKKTDVLPTELMTIDIDTANNAKDVEYFGYTSNAIKGESIMLADISWDSFFHAHNNPGGYKDYRPALVLLTPGKDDQYFVIRLSPNENSRVDPIFSGILSTFKFTNPSWKTYINPYTNYEVKYPPYWEAVDKTGKSQPLGYYIRFSDPAGKDKNTLMILSGGTTARGIEGWENEKEEMVVLGGINATKKTFHPVESSSHRGATELYKGMKIVLVDLSKGSTEYSLQFLVQDASLPLADQVLSTFDFLRAVNLRVVWSEPDEIPVGALHECLREDIECVRSVMKKHGANEDAIKFFEETSWFATKFQEYGLVDLVTLADIWRENANDDYAFVNGTPSPLVIAEEMSGDLSLKVVDYSRLTDIFPKYTLWNTDDIFLEKQNNSFLFGFSLKDERGCHACNSGFMAVIAFDFDSTGKYLGPRFVGTKKEPPSF